jgi:hypothetical protein
MDNIIALMRAVQRTRLELCQQLDRRWSASDVSNSLGAWLLSEHGRLLISDWDRNGRGAALRV